MEYKEIEHINFDDAPEGWVDRCSGDGYEKYLDKNGERRYKDNNILVGDLGYRPCAKCGKYPNERGDDACIANLGNVMNACCGHGKNEGYVMFDNGVTIRGQFKIEQSAVLNKPCRSCETLLSPDDKYCRECGEKVKL